MDDDYHDKLFSCESGFKPVQLGLSRQLHGAAAVVAVADRAARRLCARARLERTTSGCEQQSDKLGFREQHRAAPPDELNREEPQIGLGRRAKSELRASQSGRR